ncbi:MAG: class I SAM-dependent methyltransferase [Bacteroidota bacterium]
MKKYFVSMYELVVGKLSQDIRFARSVRSLISTIDYVEQHMQNIMSVDKNLKVHDVAIEQITIKDGIVMEFGVFTGTTINHIAKKLKNTKIYGFDSFEGLPEYWRDGFKKGSFTLDQLPKVEANVTLIKGWFDKTLPEFKPDNRPLAYLHVDCDLYSSTKTIFQYLKNSIVTGTVIVFDEYFNYPGWQEGEFKAFKELLEETGKEYKYLTYNRKHEQVAVIITKG